MANHQMKGNHMETVKIELTPRELTLIRVALLVRMDRLHKRADMQQSYDESKSLLNGKLWQARKEFSV